MNNTAMFGPQRLSAWKWASIVRRPFFVGCAASVALFAWASTTTAGLIHRYSFTVDASDSVGDAHGTLVDGPNPGTPTFSGGQLQLNNANFSGPSETANYLELPSSILPTSGSVTIEAWFTFGGSGYYSESWAFSDREGGTNPPGPGHGQYLMHTLSNPLGGPNPQGGGSSIAQATMGYSFGGDETRAYSTTVGIGDLGGGYLDNGDPHFSAAVIDADTGTLSYYVYRVSDGVGGLQSSIAAIPLSSYSFTDAYIGRSPFGTDNATNGSMDEFRIYDMARSAEQIAADFALGPNQVPEPSALGLLAIGLIGILPTLPWPRKKESFADAASRCHA